MYENFESDNYLLSPQCGRNRPLPLGEDVPVAVDSDDTGHIHVEVGFVEGFSKENPWINVGMTESVQKPHETEI